MKPRFSRAGAALLSLLCLAAICLPMHGQLTPTIKVTSKVVTLPVTVRDKKGKIVHDLTVDDFALQEDGRPQTIKYFEQQVDTPLVLGLLVDTSLSQRNVLDEEKVASGVFLDDMMNPERDSAFLIQFDFEVELVQDSTSIPEDLRRGLESLDMPTRASRGGGGTLLYDAVYLAANDLMKKKPGRKALILLTDGDDHGSKEPLEVAIEEAQRSDTVVYSILFADDHPLRNLGGGFGGGGHGRHGGGYPGGGGQSSSDRHDGKRILERISNETGGHMYVVSKKETLEDIYKSIGEDLRTQYSMGYVPDKASSAGYHKITLEAKKKELKVQTRDGYYATQ